MDEKKIENPENKGVRIQLLARVFITIGLALLVFLGVSLYTVVSDYHRLTDSVNTHIQSQDSIAQLQNGSDTMTEQSCLFAVSMDPASMQKYFEVVDNHTRENAYSELVRNISSKESKESLRVALKESDALMDAEIHSMKLISEAANVESDSIPEAVQSYQLSSQEQNWSSSRKLEQGRVLVFGQQYRKDKKRIDADIQNAVDEMSDELESNTDSSLTKVGALINRMVVLCVLLAMLLLTVLMTIRSLIVKPIQMQAKCIKENRRLEMLGASELQSLAITYNKMFQKNEDNRMHTDYLLEHDSLTGACSRRGFEEQKKLLAQSQIPIALLVFDIDNFKEVNDTYGHEVGDRALEHVVKTVRKFLRSDDILARIGGDEFALVLINVYSFSEEVIGEKMERINRTLMHPEDDTPKLSLSIGVAFSEHGYDEELFRRADKAMYEAKQSGRRGYKISAPDESASR